MKYKILIIFIIFLALAAAGGWFYYSKHPQTNFLNLSFGTKQPAEEIQQAPSEMKQPVFKNLGPAPEITGVQKWFNGEAIALPEMQGQVVLVNFWTYSCINCIRNLPKINDWHEAYKDQGLVVLGIHTPEFTFERVASNVEAAIKRYEIKYTVAQDNNYAVWRAFGNQFWPAQYLIDKNGDVIYTNYGEGRFEQTELAIRMLLGLEGEFIPPSPVASVTGTTPEIYTGSLRLKNFGGTEQPSAEQQIYAFPKRLAKNTFALEGRWRFEPEALVHTEGYGRLRLNFNSNKAAMVAQSAKPITAKIYIDGKLQKGVTISNSNLYPLFESVNAAAHTLEIELTESGLQIFTFTFN